MSQQYISPVQRTRFIATLRQRKDALALNFAELSVLWTISDSAIAAHYHGQKDPVTRMMAVRFAKALEMPLDELLGPAEDPTPPEPPNPFLEMDAARFLDHARAALNLRFALNSAGNLTWQTESVPTPQTIAAIRHHDMQLRWLVEQEARAAHKEAERVRAFEQQKRELERTFAQKQTDWERTHRPPAPAASQEKKQEFMQSSEATAQVLRNSHSLIKSLEAVKYEQGRLGATLTEIAGLVRDVLFRLTTQPLPGATDINNTHKALSAQWGQPERK